MLNRDFILKQLAPHLNKKREISEFEFNELFSSLTLHEQYEIIKIMIEEEIDYVEEKEEELAALPSIPLLDSTPVTSADYQQLLSLTNEELCYPQLKHWL